MNAALRILGALALTLAPIAALAAIWWDAAAWWKSGLTALLLMFVGTICLATPTTTKKEQDR